jgi:hypothetical protein
MNKKLRTLVVIGVLAGNLSGCVPVCNRHLHLDFSDVEDMKITEVGKLDYGGVLQYKKIPLKYELRRDTYTLYFHVKVQMRIHISAYNKEKQLTIRMMQDYSNPTSICYGVFGKEFDFTWFNQENCSKSQKIEISITAADGSEVGREILPFKVIADGIYCYTDTI